MDNNNIISEGNTNWICSCDIRRTGNGLKDSNCWHMGCLKNEVMKAEIENILECGFIEDHVLYLGETLYAKETGKNGKYIITGTERNSSEGRSE